ncbi:MAG: S8 family serine peptidase [Acidobacteria bacterium]|nr:S8 family serine peptidase [Acidobacteriota bacterium]MCI0622422.1 S8 family serine peptidase [Acidobacteriota bacterium]
MSFFFVNSKTLRRVSLSLLLATASTLWTIPFPWTANAQNRSALRLGRIQGVNPPAMYVPDEFVLVLKHSSRANAQAGVEPSGLPVLNLPSLQQLIRRHSVGRFQRQFPGAPTRPLGALPDLSGHYKVRLPSGANLDGAITEFANDPNVESVEKIGVHPLNLDPNDYFYSANPPVQWHLWGAHGIDANLAWDEETGKQDVVVAILDSGVRYTHPDLNGNIWSNPGEIANNGLDDDNNGKVDDVLGYDFVASADPVLFYVCCDADCGIVDNDPSDHNGHGTHVAGTVSAVTNNANGVAGIAGGYSDGTPGAAGNGVKIMPLRIGWNAAFFGLDCGTGLVRMDYAAEAMYYVATQKARGVNVAAVNCSWGSSNSGGLAAAVDNLLANDVMIIHAAGNSNSSSADYLGSRADVMNVAATDINGSGASFTNYGSWVDLAAPGVDIVSTYHVYTDPNTEWYAVSSGTSMATPHACGVAALLESANPSLTGPQKFNLMVSNVKPYTDSLSRYLGSGILSAKKALDAAGGGGNTPPTANNVSQNATEDTAVTISLSGSDPEQCDLAFSIVTTPSKGTLSPMTPLACTGSAPNADSATLVYTPNLNANGADSFTYKVNDGASDSHIATVSLSIAQVNDAPLAQNKNVSTTKGTAISIQLTGNDVETCELTFANGGLSSSSGTLGSITNAACTTSPNSDSATLTYTPNPSFVGNDSFTYTVNDGVATSSPATVSITVTDPGTGTSHVGDLDGASASINPNNWRATVTIAVHSATHTAVSGATVTGTWSAGSAGSGSCTTGTDGRCSVSSANLSKKKVSSVIFSVAGVTHPSFSYNSAANHEPDGDSTGSSITVSKP